jgi:hypothetical protein
MLNTNNTLETLNLEGNKIGNDGAIALANALRRNTSLTSLVLLGQEKRGFGESCLEAWTECLTNNVTILQIQWNLESHKRHALNQFFTRNQEIARKRKAGMDVESLLPAVLRAGKADEEILATALVATENEQPAAPVFAFVQTESLLAQTDSPAATGKEDTKTPAFGVAQKEKPLAPTEAPAIAKMEDAAAPEMIVEEAKKPLGSEEPASPIG